MLHQDDKQKSISIIPHSEQNCQGIDCAAPLPKSKNLCNGKCENQQRNQKPTLISFFVPDGSTHTKVRLFFGTFCAHRRIVSIHFRFAYPIPTNQFFVFFSNFYLFGLYDVLNIRPILSHIKRFGSALITSFVVGIFLFYFVPVFRISPKTNLIFQALGFGLLSFLIRRLIYHVFAKKITRPVILVGENRFFEELEQIITKNPQIGLQIISHEPTLQEAIKNNANLKNLLLVLEETSNKIPQDQILNFYKNKVEVIDIADAYEKYLQKIPVEYVNQSWVIKNVTSRENIFYNVFSKIMNIVISATILIVFSPVLLICSIFIYLYDLNCWNFRLFRSF